MYLLGQPTHLASKDKGETSMSVKRGSVKGSNVLAPASPARKVKPDWLNSSFQWHLQGPSQLP